MKKVVFLFPGQGSQFVGMGKSLIETFKEAKEVFEEVDDTLSYKLSRVILEGGQEELTKTENTQPAIMATSIAAVRVLENQSGNSISSFAQAFAGHSLGEYSALCAGQSFSLKDTAKLLRIRGKSMQEAVPQGKGAMAALIGAEIKDVQTLLVKASQNGICQIANDNGAGQIVISGETSAIDAAIQMCGEYNIRKAIKLPVSAPFHSMLIESAAIKMAEAFASTEVKNPACDIISNVSVKPYKDAKEIKELLVKQVTSIVRWRETMEYFKTLGYTNFVEVGPGKVLSTLAKRIHADSITSNLLEPADFEQFFSNYN